MDIIKGRGDSLYAFLASMLLHAAIFFMVFSVRTETLRGDILFIRLASMSDINEKGKDLSLDQSEVVIKDKHNNLESLLNKLKPRGQKMEYLFLQ